MYDSDRTRNIHSTNANTSSSEFSRDRELHVMPPRAHLSLEVPPLFRQYIISINIRTYAKDVLFSAVVVLNQTTRALPYVQMYYEVDS